MTIRSMGGEDPPEKEMATQPTTEFLPGKLHGQRSLADYSPQDHKESDTTERASRIHSYIRKHSIVKGDWAKSSLAKLFRHFIQEFSASSRWPWILCVSLCLMSSRACALIKGCVLFYSRFKTTWTNRWRKRKGKENKTHQAATSSTNPTSCPLSNVHSCKDSAHISGPTQSLWEDSDH